MRKYESIWIALKRDKEVSIVAHESLHSRIIRGVIREKYKDIVWKFRCSHAGTKSKLQYDCYPKTGHVKFKLLITIDPRNL